MEFFGFVAEKFSFFTEYAIPRVSHWIFPRICIPLLPR